MYRTINYDLVTNVSLFLTGETGSCFGKWTGRMRYADQRKHFGFVLFGRKEVTINGENETISWHERNSFGQDGDTYTVELRYIKDGQSI